MTSPPLGAETHGPDDARSRVDAPQRRVRWSLVAAAASALLVCTNGPSTYIGLELMNPPDLAVESWHFLFPFGAVAIAGAALLQAHLRRVGIRSLGLPAVLLCVYLAITLASSTWSVAPQLTPGRALVGIGIAAFGAWFGRALATVEQLWSVTLGLHAGLAASVVVLLVAPGTAKMDPFLNHPYWKGIWGNRNSLAPVCVLALLTLAALVATRPRRGVVIAAAVAALVDLRLLWGASSDTALVALAAATIGTAVLAPCMRGLGRRRTPPVVAVGSAVGLAIAGWLVFFAGIDELTDRTGRDSSFTSRRPIWAAVRELIAVHPVRGYGHWAVWESPAVVADAYARLGAFGSAHNGLLEVLLGVGFVGAVPFVAFAAIAITRPFRSLWHGTDVGSLWWASVVLFAVVENLTESFVLWHSYIWVLVVAAAFVPRAGTQLTTSPGDRP